MFQPSKPNQQQASTIFSSQIQTESQLQEIEVIECDVANRLSNLNTSKADGPDGIPARLLKECSQQITPSLCSLFNLSLQSSSIPSEWKSADVAPIHKKIPRSQLKTTGLFPWPIFVSKVLERCVNLKFYDHILHLASQTQDSFLRNGSCVTQLLSVPGADPGVVKSVMRLTCKIHR